MHATGSQGTAEIIFVSSGEPALSFKTSDGRREACQSLALAQALAREHRVYVLRHADASPFSGVEVLASAAAGICGLVDDRELLRDVVLPAITAHVARGPRHVSLLALGRYATAIDQLRLMLATWDEDAEWDPTLDMACWRTAMALAQLRELLPIRALGERYSFVKFARALNLERPQTGFHLSESDLRKTLSRLASLWLKNSRHPADRVRLPEYARANGFPEHLPVVSGVDEDQVARRLFEAAKGMELVDATGISGLTHRVVKLPLRFVNSHKTLRPTRKEP